MPPTYGGGHNTRRISIVPYGSNVGRRIVSRGWESNVGRMAIKRQSTRIIVLTAMNRNAVCQHHSAELLVIVVVNEKHRFIRTPQYVCVHLI